MTVQRLRDAGFSVRLKSGGMIGVKPLEKLTDEQAAWIKSNKPALVAELQREAANGNAIHPATPATKTTKATKKLQKKGGAYRTVATSKKATKSAVTPQTELRHCVSCLHDKCSPINPSGGLTWCDVRSDVTPMLPGTRFVACVNFRRQL